MTENSVNARSVLLQKFSYSVIFRRISFNQLSLHRTGSFQTLNAVYTDI